MAKSKSVRRHSHPGRGGRGASHPKGRQLDADALDDIQALLGDSPRTNDMLIEHLHLVQDKFGCLSADHLVALADEMKMALSEVYEVATFYAHFDVVTDETQKPPPVTIRVCDSVTCELLGSEQLITELANTAGSNVRVLRAPCMGACDKAPAVAIGHAQIAPATAGRALKAAENGTHSELPDYVDFDRYENDGGYALLRECLEDKRTPEELVDILNESGLRGLGGAGFPSGRKWTFVRAEAGPRFMAVNADEGEPGTFKDRWFLERDPHRFLEGMLIGAWAVEAEKIYIYLRDEYPEIREILLRELPKCEAAGLAEPGRIQLRRGAGAYICGEESAMLESIEGKRGLPRHKPPFPAQVGLFGRPTLIHNVETLYWIRDIVQKGASWFTDKGRNGSKGLRTFSVSGRVKEPGVKIAEAGITVRELIEEYCGGMEEGHSFKGYLPGGASGGILPASMDSEPLDFGTLEQYGCLIGSAAVIILSEEDSTGDVALNLLKFFEDESCGQCTPCRNGCEKAVQLLEQPKWDKPLLEDLATTMADASICGLGQAATNGLNSVFKYFPDDVK
ncbi:MAG: NADH-quinone oxidoreductase subunit F [Rhodospirillaceae bacterium]|nr:NADH-quinone oxidoreductase subunit F [Rhodospirillaceae bacterium]|tara:strand:+ start:41991 stop:43685 length:1695 start_codon:yes stop_codon:yes gene_type:complete